MSKYLSLLAAALLSAGSLLAQDNTLTDQEVQEGWKLLWDGKTSDGWRGAKNEKFPDKGWVIEDGALFRKSGGGGDIVTVRKYKKFMLKVDFKFAPGANSGIKYFIDADANSGDGSLGVEYQILDDDLHKDAKEGRNGNRLLGTAYDLIPVPKNINKPTNKEGWNTALIIVNGNNVEHWLNGVKLLDYVRNNTGWDTLVSYSKFKDKPNFGNLAEGRVLLQDHGDEVWFKNIKVKEL